MFLSTTGGRLFVNGPDDDATTCTFSRGCCEVIRTAEKAVCGGLSHLRKCDLLSIAKANIPLRFKENSIIFYFYYFNRWFTRSDSEIHWKPPIGHRVGNKNNCAIQRIVLFTKRKQHAILESLINFTSKSIFLTIFSMFPSDDQTTYP